MSVCIIAATDLESTFLCRELKCSSGQPMLGFRLFHAVRKGRDVDIIVSGPGIANAAAASALALTHLRPGRLYNVGVCGVHSDDSALLAGVVVGTAAVFADAGVDSDSAFVPLEAADLPLAPERAGHQRDNTIALDDGPASPLAARGVFATVSASSGDPSRARRIRTRCRVAEGLLLCEDMESAAVGLMACRASVPCTVLRAISNLCGQSDHAHWKLKPAAAAAQEELLRLL